MPALAEAAAAVDLVGNCARLARAARAAGVPVFHCTAEMRADDGEFDQVVTAWRRELERR